MIGRTISHYKILDRIGAGSGGEVYLAADMRLERKVALKLIPPHLARDPDNLERFQREATVLAALNHPHIVTIYSVEEAEGLHFLTMEWIEGETLEKVIPAGGLALPDFLLLAAPLVDALDAAHRLGVTHRDLKPANLMVGRSGVLKILDFGLAKLRREDVDGAVPANLLKTITQYGVLMGTLQYMSPEQLEGRPADGRSDLFSLGAVFHEMLTGTRPFQETSGPALISAILRDTPAPVSAIRPELPLSLSRMILKCLEKEAGDRYQQASDLRADLAEIALTLTAQNPAAAAPTAPPQTPLPRSPASPRPPGPVHAAPSIQPSGKTHRRTVRLGPRGVVLLLLAASTAVFAAWKFRPGHHASRAEKQIVVLPFSFFGQPEDSYFAAGVTDEITNRLASVQGLNVVSRTNALHYDAAGKTMRQIGKDLHVDYVLEGSVSWDRSPGGGNRVRVTPQLIRASDDTHLWSERYERDANAIFEVQMDIAQQVVQKLNITLQGREREALQEKPTENQEAYLAYLKGLAYCRGTTPEDARLAAEWLSRAVALDPGFVEANYGLSRAHAHLYSSYIDRTSKRLAQARDAAEKTRSLAPDRAVGHKAMADLYLALGDFDRALGECRAILRLAPDDPYASHTLGRIMVQRGDWSGGTIQLEKAVALDPGNTEPLRTLADAYQRQRRFRDAEQVLDRGIALAPEDLFAWQRKADLYWSWEGSTGRARKILEEMPKQSDTESTRIWWLLEYLSRNWQKALDRVHAAPWFWYGNLPKPYLEYLCLVRLSMPIPARTALVTAIDSLEAATTRTPDDPEVLGALSLAYASMGREAEAVRSAGRSMELRPTEKDAWSGPQGEVYLAEAYALLGKPDPAVDLLERNLARPSNLSLGRLRMDPTYDRIRSHPRFQKLVGGK